jgi:hypothetical protein
MDVGMTGLSEIFERFAREGRPPDLPETRHQLVKAAQQAGNWRCEAPRAAIERAASYAARQVFGPIQWLNGTPAGLTWGSQPANPSSGEQQGAFHVDR